LLPRLALQKRILVIALLAVSALGLIAHSLVWNFVTDDAFISFVYARNLAEAGQLVFNLGERVEGYTNFLWTVLLAGLMKLHLAPELMSRVLGTVFAIASMWVSARLVRATSRDRAPSLWDAVPATMLAVTTGYACWASGGLETQMFTFFVTLGAGRYLRRALDGDGADGWTGLWFGLAALTRPEGVLFFALTGVHRLAVLAAKRHLPTRGDWLAIAAFLALVAPHALWRHHYYGWWLPNTFYIKASGGTGTWAQGAYYLYRMAEALDVWVAIAVALVALVLVRDRTLRTIAGYILFVTAVFYLYVASVGGDFMGLYRFVLPVVPLLFVLGAISLRALGERFSPRALGIDAVLLFVAHAAHAVPVTHRAQQIGADRGIDTPGFLRWYTADRAAIGKWFGAHRKDDDYAAVGGAGAQVYYSRIPSLDCYGLSDAHIAHDVRPVSNRPGHQKYAPLEYQLAKKPTIVTSNYYRCCSPAYGNAPFQPAPSEAADWARRGYRYVSVKVPGLSYPYYSFLLRNDRGIADIPSMDREP
jgi:arabinofuranosyltransferase